MWTGPENEVLVWTFDLDAIDSAAVAPVLSTDERERGARFRFEVHRDRYIAGRGTMRVALGAVADVAPEELEFAYGAHGKPELKPLNGPKLHFNLSHSDNRAILGVTRAGPLGVDVEGINLQRGNRDVARRFFSPREIADLDGLTGEAYAQGFFRCWARKEAVLKAVGTGIMGGLSSFSVPIDEMPDPVHIATPDCWIGNLSGAFPYLESVGFSSAVALLEKVPLVRAVCDTVLRIPVRRTFK
jgi:4'-phosphopantetheinyl transferase